MHIDRRIHEAWLKIGKTNIFARHTRPGFQVVVYSMAIASRTRAAMILPLPVVPGSGEEALNFIDLSGYPEFFEDVYRACAPETLMVSFEDDDLGAADEAPPLVVHEVGDFEASYVPTMADFHRLDPRFRLADEVWKKMPDYSDYDFAVFQLKLTLSDEGDEKTNNVHPMAFEFPTRDSEQLFYPTVHVHDGDYHEEAGFLHTFYCQRENARTEFEYRRARMEGVEPAPVAHITEILEPGLGHDWFLTSGPAIASEVLKIDQCQGIVDPDKSLHGMNFFGTFPNLDVWIGTTG